MFQGETGQHHVKRCLGKGIWRAAQVDDRELVEVGEWHRRRVDVGPDQAFNPWPEAAQRRDAAAARVEDRDPTRSPLLGRADRVIERLADEGTDRGPDAQPRKKGEPPGLVHAYRAVEVAASVMPWASSQRSASIAALQPSPAAVTACR